MADSRRHEPRVAIAYDCLFPIDTGGGERVYRRMAELLAARGASVTYVTRTGRRPGPGAEFAVAGVWSGEIADADGTRTTSSAVGFALALFRHFVRHRRGYDLVVVAALPVLNVFAVRLALLGSRAVVATDWLEIWSWRKWRDYSGLGVGTIAFVLQSVGVHVGRIQTVNSGFTGARLRRYRRRADPIVLGLVDLVHPSYAPARREGAPTALFVGRHIPDKRLASLPAAIASARSVLPDLEAVVAGSGPETGAARRAAELAGVADVIRFAGRVGEGELEALLADAAVLVNPSAREGFGLVVAEAASHGTPSVVVAGEDNAAAELVVDGVNGYVAASVDAEILGDAIVRAVRGGSVLRRSTSEWFDRERRERSLGRSVDELVARWRAISGR
ncbi:glycosyltransferase involved in cell wall biosynthesis [Agromyces sp. 3263]|uniref:glycosyltransferase family 4 protein n=1 Tax=Agromyces sp. 3263 TaxID=2817750 RepID=UPI00285E1E17|nr:glycosyltransferase family 4 protein [Agromyces sp. 3263]MDR6904634.1 glycosyltransferase involved in cell wall biosynthesis [Agromyces sp. 3263]